MFVVPESNVTKAYLSFVVECSSLEQKTVWLCVIISMCGCWRLLHRAITFPYGTNRFNVAIWALKCSGKPNRHKHVSVAVNSNWIILNRGTQDALYTEIAAITFTVATLDESLLPFPDTLELFLSTAGKFFVCFVFVFFKSHFIKCLVLAQIPMNK